MNKRLISIVLSLIMILGNVNAVFAEIKTANPTPEWVCLRGNNTNPGELAVAEPSWAGNKFVSFIKFDLKDFLPEIYLCDSIKFSIKSTSYSVNENAAFDLSIVSDDCETYDKTTVTYSNAGDLLNSFPVFYHSDNAGNGVTHTSGNIKVSLIEALESGQNETVVIKLSASGTARADFVPDSIALNISYNTDKVTDADYCELISSKFKFDDVVGVSSGEVKESFNLPTFYRGTEVFWFSDNDAVTIDADDTRKALVTRPVGFNASLTLKAVFTDNTFKSFVSKEFPLIVQGMGAIDAAAENFDINTIFSDGDNQDSVTRNLNLPKSYETFNLSWTSDDEYTLNPYTGRILRPTDSDKTVTLTPTLSLGSDAKTLNPIILTVKKDTGDKQVLSSAEVAVVKFNGGAQADQDDSILYSRSGSYSGGGVLYNRYVSYIMFDISDVKDAIVNSAGSVHINLTGQRWYSTETRSDNECYNLYIIGNSDWDSTLTYSQANTNGMIAHCADATYNDPDAIYCSPKGQMAYNKKYTTTDILPEIKTYIANNPDSEKISFMLFIPNNEAMVRFYGASGTDDQKPSLEIRY